MSASPGCAARTAPRSASVHGPWAAHAPPRGRCRLSSWPLSRYRTHTVNGLVFYIGLGLGLALAAGVRPFLPALLAGALASSEVLGVSFPSGSYHFLQAGWWLLAVTAVLVLSYAAQLVV